MGFLWFALPILIPKCFVCILLNPKILEQGSNIFHEHVCMDFIILWDDHGGIES